MKEEQINKIIYDYMGDWTDGCPTCGYPPLYSGNYTESLDALVPVVERLGKLTMDYVAGKWMVSIYGLKFPDAEYVDESPSLALATACAKVIKDSNE